MINSNPLLLEIKAGLMSKSIVVELLIRNKNIIPVNINQTNHVNLYFLEKKNYHSHIV